MNTNTRSWLARYKWVAVLIGIRVLAGAWWALRPERLFINQKVNEEAQAALSAGPETLYTGKLAGKAHPTSGSTTVYNRVDGKGHLRLSEFTQSKGPDVRRILVLSENKAPVGETVQGDVPSD